MVLGSPEKKHSALHCYIQVLVLLINFIQGMGHSSIF
jgi:hypothetical protein